MLFIIKPKVVYLRPFYLLYHFPKFYVFFGRNHVETESSCSLELAIVSLHKKLSRFF